MKRALPILLLPFFLAGCAAVWGQAYKVEFASSERVIIEYDPSLTDVGTLMNVAQKQCSRYGETAEPDRITRSQLGMLEAWYVCQ